MPVPPPSLAVPCRTVRGSAATNSLRQVPAETAVAFTYNRAAYAVMMATPADLEDFGVGFSLTEGLISSPRDIADLEIVPTELGIEVRMEIDPALAGRMAERRRRMAGPVGCGLCGLESLKDAARALPAVAGALSISRDDVCAAVAALSAAQALNGATHAVHGAGFWRPGAGVTSVREDVGRHNALDKLAGALARHGEAPPLGAVVISSRVSVEMVQKTAMMGAPVLIAVSAPTALAIRTAADAGLTLVAVARADGFEVFTHPERIS